MTSTERKMVIKESFLVYVTYATRLDITKLNAGSNRVTLASVQQDERRTVIRRMAILELTFVTSVVVVINVSVPSRVIQRYPTPLRGRL